MKVGALKKLISEAIAAPVQEMCGTKKIKETHNFAGTEPQDPDNPEYMRGWENGFEAGKIGAAMFGESIKKSKQKEEKK